MEIFYFYMWRLYISLWQYFLLLCLEKNHENNLFFKRTTPLMKIHNNKKQCFIAIVLFYGFSHHSQHYIIEILSEWVVLTFPLFIRLVCKEWSDQTGKQEKPSGEHHISIQTLCLQMAFSSLFLEIHHIEVSAGPHLHCIGTILLCSIGIRQLLVHQLCFNVNTNDFSVWDSNAEGSRSNT